MTQTKGVEMATKQYEKHSSITKELLDGIKVGDLIKVNDWKKPYRVKGVTTNYFVMTTNHFGEVSYSVCEKKKRTGGNYNKMRSGMFHVGGDTYIFGYVEYDFNNPKFTADFLALFDLPDEDITKRELSVRSSVPIEVIQIKRT